LPQDVTDHGRGIPLDVSLFFREKGAATDCAGAEDSEVVARHRRVSAHPLLESPRRSQRVPGRHERIAHRPGSFLARRQCERQAGTSFRESSIEGETAGRCRVVTQPGREVTRVRRGLGGARTIRANGPEAGPLIPRAVTNAQLCFIGSRRSVRAAPTLEHATLEDATRMRPRMWTIRANKPPRERNRFEGGPHGRTGSKDCDHG